MNAQFKVGDIVQIVDNGKSYTTYDTMFYQMGFVNKERNPFFPNGTICQIFAMARHPGGGHYLAVRDLNGLESLITADGVAYPKFERRLPSLKIGEYDVSFSPAGFDVGCTSIKWEKWDEIKRIVTWYEKEERS